MQTLKLGYTAGIFDLFHIGHLKLLENCKKHCDVLRVDVMSDAYSVKIKGKLPTICQNDRLELLKGCKFVNHAVINNGENTTMYDILGVECDITFKGSDWQGTEKWNFLEEELKSRGVEVMFFPYTDLISSSKIIQTILKRSKK